MDKNNSSEPPSSSSIDSFKKYLNDLYDKTLIRCSDIDVGAQTKSANKILIKEIQNTLSMVENIEKEMRVISYFSSNRL